MIELSTFYYVNNDGLLRFGLIDSDWESWTVDCVQQGFFGELVINIHIDKDD